MIKMIKMRKAAVEMTITGGSEDDEDHKDVDESLSDETFIVC